MSHRFATTITILLGAAISVTAASDYSFITINVPGFTKTVATDINNGGAIVGYGNVGSTQTGFLDNAGQLTSIFVPGSSATMANGLNDLGQIVGTYSNSSGSYWRVG